MTCPQALFGAHAARMLPIIGLTLLLTGCEAAMLGNVLVGCAMRPTPEFMPKDLPAAKAGEAYEVRIEVVDASSPVSRILDDPQHPLPQGLGIVHRERERYGLIRGVPEQPGTYEVLLYAGTYGTQCVGLRATQVYTLEVGE